MAALILIIEDEPDLVQTLEYNLEREGFSTRSALSGAEGLALAERPPRPDLILLDLMLPDTTGTAVCRALKLGEHTRDIPVVMLTARGEEIDRVVGFEVGAEDYVTKPFSVRELMLRIRVILRRVRSAPAPGGQRLALGRVRLDEAGHRTWVDGAEVSLTALEFRLLLTFLRQPGRALSREALLARAWGEGVRVSSRTVDVHIKRLREKLGPAGRYIETVRGVGYRLRDRPDGEDR